jgi:hypothetical protein
MHTKDRTTPRPNGMSLKAWRTRNHKPSCEAICSAQVLSATVGLNTSGALAGIRASSFPNPVLAPPFLEKVMTIFAQWYSNVNLPLRPPCHIKSGHLIPRLRSAFSTLTIGAGDLIITRKYFWNEHIYADPSRRSNVYDSQKSTFGGEMA